MSDLRQTTAVTLTFGPLFDDTDGKTLKTGLTLAATDVKVAKNGGAPANKSDATAPSDLGNGYYSVALNTTDTGTVGLLEVTVIKAGAVTAFKTYNVKAQSWYDQSVGTGNMSVDLIAGALTSIKSKVLEIFNTDTFAQPAQGAPGATVTLAYMMSYLYKLARNKLFQSTTEFRVYANDGTTVDHKATVSDDGSTFNRGLIGAGP